MFILREKYSSIFKSILLVIAFQLFLFKIVETATAHQHTLADGRVIVVSHFLVPSSSSNGTPAKSHHHTEFELFLLQLLTGLYIAVMGAAIAMLALRLFKKRREELVQNAYPFFIVSIPSLRAPPAFI